MEYFAASAYLISTGCKFNSCLNLSYNLIKQSLVEVLSMTSSRHVVPTYTKTSMILQSVLRKRGASTTRRVNRQIHS
jgi:hypothetical protein